MRFPPARGVIFDLDGTLVDSGLDFDAMRREMQLPTRQPILEAIAALPTAQAERCWKILHRHEREGAARARPMPHVEALLALLAQRGLRRAVLTRNSREAAEGCLQRLSTPFDLLLSREDAPPKPDPLGIFKICRAWALHPREVAMVGDFRFDLEAARHAGTRAVLYTQGQSPEDWADFPAADYLLHSFEAAADFVAWLEQPL
jgi:HAD superfamily hydrolase (TIGR01549 family)